MATLSAYGRCEEIELELHCNDEHGWLQLRTTHATFRWKVLGPETLGAMVQFLEARDGGPDELPVGWMDRATVDLARDCSSGTARYWLKVRPDDGYLSLDFADDQARKLLEAVRDAHADLRPRG